jgi:hypothetical protein
VKTSNGLFLLTKVFSSCLQAFFSPMAKNWSLGSLTIGPIFHTTDLAFWRNAFHNFPAVPRLKELTITYYYPNTEALDESCWTFFSNIFCRPDIFPRAMQVDIRVAIRSSSLSDNQQRSLDRVLSPLRMFHTVTFWGRCE